MIKYKEYKVIEMQDFENFLMDNERYREIISNLDSFEGPRLLWSIFAEFQANNSYKIWDLDMIYETIDTAVEEGDYGTINILNCVVDEIKKKNIPEEFLLHIFGDTKRTLSPLYFLFIRYEYCGAACRDVHSLAAIRS